MCKSLLLLVGTLILIPCGFAMAAEISHACLVGDYGGGKVRIISKDGEIEWAPTKLYWTAWPRSRVRAFADARLEQGTIDKSTHERMAAAGFPDDQVTAWIDVRDRYKQKEAAWKAHRTQIPEDWFLINIPDSVEEEVLGREAFARIASSIACTDVEDDLFAGLR